MVNFIVWLIYVIIGVSTIISMLPLASMWQLVGLCIMWTVLLNAALVATSYDD